MVARVVLSPSANCDVSSGRGGGGDGGEKKAGTGLRSVCGNMGKRQAEMDGTGPKAEFVLYSGATTAPTHVA